ncbi:hypothetical protein DFP72DRAFT_851016, partial [Ephemerocybe angulata]
MTKSAEVRKAVEEQGCRLGSKRHSHCALAAAVPYLVEASTKELGATSSKLLRRGCPPLEVHPENGTKEAPTCIVSKPPLLTVRNTMAQTFAEAFRGFPLVMPNDDDTTRILETAQAKVYTRQRLGFIRSAWLLQRDEEHSDWLYPVRHLKLVAKPILKRVCRAGLRRCFLSLQNVGDRLAKEGSLEKGWYPAEWPRPFWCEQLGLTDIAKSDRLTARSTFTVYGDIEKGIGMYRRMWYSTAKRHAGENCGGGRDILGRLQECENAGLRGGEAYQYEAWPLHKSVRIWRLGCLFAGRDQIRGPSDQDLHAIPLIGSSQRCGDQLPQALGSR